MSLPAAELASHLGVSVAGDLARPHPTDLTGSVLPVIAELAGLLPAGGLRRGSVLRVERSVALTLALLGAASQGGAWCAVVGMPALGVLAATELGVDAHRLVLIPDPGPDWPVVVAALLDAADIVVLKPPGGSAGSNSRRLSARVRERGAVLLVLGEWEGAEVVLTPTDIRWHGIGSGHGRLVGCQLAVESSGRGAAGRPRHARLLVGETEEVHGGHLLVGKTDKVLSPALPRSKAA